MDKFINNNDKHEEIEIDLEEIPKLEEEEIPKLEEDEIPKWEDEKRKEKRKEEDA